MNKNGGPTIGQGTEEAEELSGVLDRITFHSEESGFTVARLLTVGRGSKTVTVVGALPG